MFTKLNTTGGILLSPDMSDFFIIWIHQVCLLHVARSNNEGTRLELVEAENFKKFILPTRMEVIVKFILTRTDFVSVCSSEENCNFMSYTIRLQQQ